MSRVTTALKRTELDVSMDASQRRFEALFRAHYPAVRRYAYHRAITGSNADDLVAETFIVAWRRLDAVPIDDALPWLLAVAGNVQRNQARSHRRYQALIERLPSPQSSPPPAIPSDVGPQIRAALAALSDDDREILLLVAWDGLTPQQAAVAIGTTPGSARLRLHRARKRFATQFELGSVRTQKRASSDGQFRIDRKELSHEQTFRF